MTENNNKSKTKYIFKWIGAIIFFIFLLISLGNTAFLAVILFLLGGLILLPPLSKFWLEKVSFLKNKVLKSIVLVVCFIGGIISLSLNTQKSEYTPKYEIISQSKQEKVQKAALVIDAAYKDTIYTKEAMKKVLFDIYNKNKHKDVFKRHDEPNAFFIKLYSSKKMKKIQPGNWLASFNKPPQKSKPAIQYGMFNKLKHFQGSKDTVKTEDEIAVEKLKAYLSKKGTSLCSVYFKLIKIETKCINIADKKYPDLGPENLKYSVKITKKKKKEFAQKSKIDKQDSIFSYVTTFGLIYCK